METKDAPSVVIMPAWSCYKCGEAFADERSLERHLNSQRSGSCIGVWFVCRRCLNFFDTPSELKRHQSLKRGCAKALLGGKMVKASASGKEVPIEAMTAVRLKKGAQDAGGMPAYLERVVLRGNHQEIQDVLQACTVEDLGVFLDYVQSVADDTALFIDLLAVLSNYGNTEDISPEKRAKIRPFVELNITL